MRIGVCGIACERCPRMVQGRCPHGQEGCRPKDNPFCRISTCAHRRGIRLCFECPDFPCENTRCGPIAFDYCRFISGRSD